MQHYVQMLLGRVDLKENLRITTVSPCKALDKTGFHNLLAESQKISSDPTRVLTSKLCGSGYREIFHTV